MKLGRQMRTRTRAALVIVGLSLMGIGFCGVNPVSASPRARTSALDPSRTATASKAEHLDNEVVTITWTGFRPTSQDGSNSTIILQCTENPQSLSDCFTAEAYPAIANGNRKVGRTLDDGTGSVQFEVRPAAQLPQLNCSAKNPCSVMVYESNAEAIPADGLPSTAALAPLEFAPSVADCPPVVDFDLRFDGSASASAQFYRWAADKCDGKDPIVIDYTSSSDNSGRDNFLSGLVDGGVTGLAVTEEDRQLHPDAGEYSYAPVDLTAVVIAVNMRDPMTGEPVTDLTLSPRLVAKLITDSDVTNLFTDPEFRRLNARVRVPLNGVDYPLLRAEKNADSYIITSWMSQDEEAQKFLNGEDTYRKLLNPAYQGLEYPRDIFENVAQSANFLPRQGEANVALKLFYGIAPNGSVPLNLAETGVLGIVDLPTAQRFGLSTAKIVNAAGIAVAPTEESILAGYTEMKALKNGTRINNFKSANENAYPLVKVDYLMVPTAEIDNSKNKSLQEFLKFAIKGGQRTLLPGYLSLPDELITQTSKVVDELEAAFVIPTTTTSSTTTTTQYVPDYQPNYGSNSDETTTTTSTAVTTTTTAYVASVDPLDTLPRGQSMMAFPLILGGAALSSVGLFSEKLRKLRGR